MTSSRRKPCSTPVPTSCSFTPAWFTKDRSCRRGSAAGCRLSPSEVVQKPKSPLLAFLRVELGGDDVVLPADRGEKTAVIGFGRDDGAVGRRDEITVDEVCVAV